MIILFCKIGLLQKPKYVLINENLEILNDSKIKGGILDNHKVLVDFISQNPINGSTNQKLILIPFGAGNSYIKNTLLTILSKNRKICIIVHDPDDFVFFFSVLDEIKYLFDYTKITLDLESINFVVFSNEAFINLISKTKIKQWQIKRLGSYAPSLLPPRQEISNYKKEYISILGYWNKARNLNDTISCIKILFQDYRDVKLVWAGEIPRKFQKRIYRELEKAKIPLDFVNFKGRVEEHEYCEIIESSKFVIHLRKNTSGESSGVLSDLLSRETPAIITRIGINDTLPALFRKVRAGDIEALANVIKELQSFESDFTNNQSSHATLEVLNKHQYSVAIHAWLSQIATTMTSGSLQTIKQNYELGQKLLLVDRDGTINVDEGYTYKIEDLKLIGNFVEILQKAFSNGWQIVVVTNQSSIGRGICSLEDVYNFNREIAKQLAKHEIEITAFIICPHIPSEYCYCRKPKSGMLLKAIEIYRPSKIVMIGNANTDIQSAQNINIPAFLVGESEDILLNSNILAQ